jgi:nickel-dependent lactate racemase
MTPDKEHVFSAVAPEGGAVSHEQVAGVVNDLCPADDYVGKRVLLIVPDGTRTAPIGLIFKMLFDQISGATRKLDVMIALGTHQPMSEAAICARLDISPEDRRGLYRDVEFINHEWDNPAALRHIGTIGKDEISFLTDGRFAMDVPVEINKRLFDLIIGNKWTPVRKVVDKAGALVDVSKKCFCLVVRPDKSLAGLFGGSPESAWDDASELSRRTHIVLKDRPFQTVLSCVPPMYEDLWTGGKGMYKLEPVVADGGELIIYAPHIKEVSVTHGKTLLEIGYHCRDYFLKQWDQFKSRPWGVIAHATHVRGLGTYENGVEQCRIKLTIASQIPEKTCHQINLGYRDPATINVEDFANREDEGVLLVRKAGEMLYQLKNPPAWAARS